MDAIKRLSISYYKLSKGERALSKKIIEKPTVIIENSITVAAKIYDVSVSTIQRLIKKCEYKGYSELRYVLNNDLKHSDADFPKTNHPLTQIVDGYMDSIAILKKEMYFESATYIKKQIIEANHLFIVGLGGSSYIAGYLEHMLYYGGRPAIFINEQERFNYVDDLLQKDDVIILFSVSGAEAILNDYDVDSFTNKGVVLILITMQEDTKVDNMIDYKVVLPRLPVIVNDQYKKEIYIDNTSMFILYVNILLFILNTDTYACANER